MNLVEFVQTHYRAEHSLTCTEGSLKQILFSVESFGEHLGRPATIEDLDKSKVIAWMAARKETRASSTVNKGRRMLLCVWRCAAERELVGWPPKIPKVRVPKEMPHTFTADEMRRIVAASVNFPNHTLMRSLLLFLFDSAARITAALSVKICDCDLDEKVVTLRAENSKTGTGSMVSIADDTAQAIAAHILGRDRNECIWKLPFRPAQLFLLFRKLAHAANVDLPKGKCFHSIRRTTASAVADQFGIETASQLLGHSSLQVTKLYLRTDDMRVVKLRLADSLPRPAAVEQQVNPNFAMLEKLSPEQRESLLALARSLYLSTPAEASPADSDQRRSRRRKS